MTTEATQTVGDLTIAEFRALVREIVVEVVVELIDPDEGLELSDWAVARLEKAEAEIAAGERHTIPLEESARRLGLPRP